MLAPLAYCLSPLGSGRPVVAGGGGGIETSPVAMAPGLHLLYHAGSMAASDGELRSTWPEISAARDMSAVNDAQRPTYKTGVLSGKNAMRFSEAHRVWRTVTIPRLGSLYVVFNKTGTMVNYARLFETGINNGLCMCLDVTATKITFQFGANGSPVLVGPVLTNGVTYIADMVLGGVEDRKGYVNGVHVGTAAASGTSATFVPYTANIGGLDGGGYHWRGDIGTVVYYTTTHTAAERLTVRQWLANHYGISI